MLSYIHDAKTLPSLVSPINTGSIHIVLHEDSTALDHLQSCFQACVLDYVIRTRPNLRKVTSDYLSFNLLSAKSYFKSLWDQNSGVLFRCHPGPHFFSFSQASFKRGADPEKVLSLPA